MSTYLSFFKTAGNGFFVVCVIILMVFAQIATSSTDYFLSKWFVDCNFYFHLLLVIKSCVSNFNGSLARFTYFIFFVHLQGQLGRENYNINRVQWWNRRNCSNTLHFSHGLHVDFVVWHIRLYGPCLFILKYVLTHIGQHAWFVISQHHSCQNAIFQWSPKWVYIESLCTRHWQYRYTAAGGLSWYHRCMFQRNSVHDWFFRSNFCVSFVVFF